MQITVCIVMLLLTLAVIFSGGRIELGKVGKAELPSLGNAIRDLRHGLND